MNVGAAGRHGLKIAPSTTKNKGSAVLHVNTLRTLATSPQMYKAVAVSKMRLVQQQPALSLTHIRQKSH